MRRIPVAAWLVLAWGLVMVAGVIPFLVAIDATAPEPVPFDDVVELGISVEHQHELEAEGLSIPRVEIFYSQYRYVVGYHGVERFVNALAEPGHYEQFGYPVTVYVSDYSDRTVTLTDEGYLRPDHLPDWVAAEDAAFVVGSAARSPAGETVVPFSAAADAAAFAADHGGNVLGWDELRDRRFDVDDAGVVREEVDERYRSADDLVATAENLRDRPVSIVVGEDVETIQAGIDAAPANTTVLIGEGTYHEHVVVDRSITLAGDENVTIDGGGVGTVVTLAADRSGVTGVSIVGVGNETRDPEAATDDPDAWDHNIQLGYGHGDAGVATVGARESLVADVSIETPANGVVLRDAPDAVVDGIHVDGSEEWRDGFMGVMAMRSPAVVQGSTFEGGRDAVYAHRSHGLVVRDSVMRDGRFGVHLMHTSDTLIANNVASNHLAGIVVMTGPQRNVIVGNDVRESGTGIIADGSDSYVAYNVVVDNARGLTTGATTTIYEHNVLVRNEVGARSTSIIPSSRVVANDFVDNDQHATAGSGPLTIWTHDGLGNYWDGAPGSVVDGSLDRPYSPTDPIDARLGRTAGARTLAEAPGILALGEFRGTVPGMRTGSIVDTNPRAEPSNPALLAAAERDPLATDPDGYWNPPSTSNDNPTDGARQPVSTETPSADDATETSSADDATETSSASDVTESRSQAYSAEPAQKALKTTLLRNP